MSTISMQGILDLNTAPRLFAELMDRLAPGTSTRLDLSEVTWIDSAGLAALVRLLSAARQRGGDLIVERASEAVVRMMTLERLDTLFAVDQKKTAT